MANLEHMRLVRAGLVTVIVAASALAAAQRPEPAPGVRLTIHTPQAEEFDLAVDEIELDSSRASVVSARARPTPVREARVTASQGTRAVLAFRTVETTSELLTVVRELEAANPGARAQLVLYQSGRPRSSATRRVLTSRIAVLLEDADDPRGVVRAYASYDPAPLAGVPGAYVLDARDPLAAIDLADQLRTQPGVKTAYPLLERQQFAR